MTALGVWMAAATIWGLIAAVHVMPLLVAVQR